MQLLWVHAFYRPRSHPDRFDVNVLWLGDLAARFSVVPFDGQRWEENIASLTEAPSAPIDAPEAAG